MCEWLACGDWCDVRLICGGRFFNAHRAVLASVSSFLRKVLLSCPVDESPVFIYFPEYDLDAMSSVLYYIYNGEVLIPKRRLKMFLDTANAMEIFIDQQNIQQIVDCKQYCFEPKSEACRLRVRNGINGCIINIKKGIRSEEFGHETQDPIVTLNALDKSSQTFRWSEENIPDLGNLTSISRYRQSQTFLRDIFIETYSQEGHVNGQTPSVPAISNEEYLTPGSVLFTNTMANHPSESKILSVTHKEIGQSTPKSVIFDCLKHLHDKNYRKNDIGNISISYAVNNQLINNFNEECIILQNRSNEPSNDLGENDTPLKISKPIMSRDSPSNLPIETHNTFTNLGITKITPGLKSFSEVPKVTILNEVLQNPWLPRQPISYRPSRNKDLAPMHIKKNDSKTSISSNDKNNNNGTQFEPNKSVLEEPISSKLQDLRCIVCQEVFRRRQDYSIHMRQHSSMNRYRCGECKKTFSQLRNFKYHMSVHRGTKEFAATCSVCGKHFNDRGYLSNHMKIHRNRKEYKCASCPKSFNQRVAFNMHVRIHTGVKPHICEECGKAFSRKMLLKQHQRTHSGERPYACAHCDKRFADRSNMTLHLRLHTGVKPFACTLCPKSFTKKHHLKSHLNFHTGAKPYSCPRCKLSFTQSSNMRTHYKKCNNDTS